MADVTNDDTLIDNSRAPSSVGEITMTEIDTLVAPESEDAANGTGRSALALAHEDPEQAPERISFISYLVSPIVTLIVGLGEPEDILTAHQAILDRSPFFKEACAQFIHDGSPRQIELPGEDLDAVGSFLEYLYTGEYFPHKISGQRSLEPHPSIPKVDETGAQLLRHARVYTLADKFQVPELRLLASSKIHCVSSTAKGEIAFARYVYAYTSETDTTIRAPVAHFWANRSHTLRAEAEPEFKAICLDYPQFGFDILTRVLNEKVKREANAKMHPSPVSTRKRPRHSHA